LAPTDLLRLRVEGPVIVQHIAGAQNRDPWSGEAGAGWQRAVQAGERTQEAADRHGSREHVVDVRAVACADAQAVGRVELSPDVPAEVPAIAPQLIEPVREQ